MKNFYQRFYDLLDEQVADEVCYYIAKGVLNDVQLKSIEFIIEDEELMKAEKEKRLIRIVHNSILEETDEEDSLEQELNNSQRFSSRRTK